MLLKYLIFSLSPILFFRVFGNSMIPQFFAEDRVIVLNKRISHVQKNDVVVLFDPRTGKPILKRVQEIHNTTYFVKGDNKSESTDSRSFGWISEKQLIGKVIYRISHSSHS